MNKTETEWAGELELMRQSGSVLWYIFEGVKLRLAGGAWYTPDFLVVDSGHNIIFYEVKGFWREAARVRIKVAAELYSWAQFVVVQKANGEWMTEIVLTRVSE